MNTTKAQLRLPEYGRLVLQMIERALNIPDRDERNEYAKLIIQVMTVVDAADEDSNSSYRKYSADYQSKLWDHLAYLSDYKLDIDYPVEITRVTPENHKAKSLSYPNHKIKYRHYGHLLEKLLSVANSTEDEEVRTELTLAAANRMKRNLADWKGDGITNEKVALDIREYTDNNLQPNFEEEDLIGIDVHHKVKTPKLN